MAIQLKNISKSFGDYTVLNGIDLYLTTNDRAGLIGPNGCGKTTLIRIIAGQIEKDSGSISIPRENFNLGHLEQFTEIEPGGTLLTEAMRGAEKLRTIEKRLRDLENRMACDNPDAVRIAGIEYSDLLHKFEHAGGYTFETEVKSILTGLGFREPDWIKPAEGLSGGERTRLALARLLADKPDFILLDEPTNHLDLPAIEWLESTLKNFDGGYLIISHDRRFLDSSCPVLFEIERGKISRYTGGYEGFLTQKAEKLERERKMIESQEKEIRQLKKFISRWSKDKIRASMAMSRKKKLDKIEASKIESSIREKAGMHIAFESSVKSFDEVLTLNNVKKSFGDNCLLNDVSFSVRLGERLAIIGRNGSGKTTLLKMIIGELEQDSGEIWLGDRTVWGYFSQTMEELDLENNVLDELLRLGRGIGMQDCRDLLARFLFSGDDIEKRVGDISGGERSKLMFAILLTRKPNCLILDEPTNHLDLPSREILEEALEEYDGTLIFVSHDRAFIDRLATHTLELETGRARMYIGSYTDVIYRKQQEKNAREEAGKYRRQLELESEKRERSRQKRIKKSGKSKKSGIKPSAANVRKMSPDKIMNQIELLEAQIKSLEEELCQPEIYMDFEKAGELNKAVIAKKLQRDELFKMLEDMING
ncbi:MAG: ABC-F family ATP-binding cassette domain-containing protein [bacterium]|nr:ABC-F family ATP-binding cassette domain-containing protein [bacterium]